MTWTWYLRYPVRSRKKGLHAPSYPPESGDAPLSAKALACLLDQAWQANERQHLTGALVYSNKRFIQLLEGEQEAIEAAYARINQDPRHQHLCQIAHYPITARRFAEWPLAFQILSPAQFGQLAGYLAPTKSGPHFPGYGSAAISFVETMRALVQTVPAAKQAQSTT